ncbi:unnamed protein product [Anisakis simplex]|uniref:Uncharacterized protein n=1 Tax=Anisakis simplex TaxID=6269 RepID=A0A3P6PGK4_ANISI|nr:unnamed protein product [Anisakis simplex]
MSTSSANTPIIAATKMVADKFEKLPELAKPVHYTLTLKPDLEKFTFDGSETVDIQVLLNFFVSRSCLDGGTDLM